MAECEDTCAQQYSWGIQYLQYFTCVNACFGGCRNESTFCGYLNSWNPQYVNTLQCICATISGLDMIPSAALGPFAAMIGLLDCACGALTTAQNACAGSNVSTLFIGGMTLGDCLLDYQAITGKKLSFVVSDPTQVLMEEYVAFATSDVFNSIVSGNNCNFAACADMLGINVG
jgi:hypothetical protein